MTTADPSLPRDVVLEKRFGTYVAIRELHRGALASIYLGRGEGEKTDVAIKRLHPPPATTLRRALALEGFIAEAEAQRAAASSSRAIAPVLDVGTTEDGCYLVRPLYRVSLQVVADAHLTPSIERLHELVRLLLEALEAWAAATGRPHGNFKPSNVFFDGEAAAGAWRVVLVDPWHQPGDSPEKRHARDMVQLGRWIVSWVRRRDAAGWPIEESPEWRVLGRAANPWREFANSLIDPSATPDTLAFPAVRERLRRLPAQSPGKRARRTAGGVIAAGALAIVVYARLGDFTGMSGLVRPIAERLGNPGARVDEVPAEFGQLCTEWDLWLALLEDQLKKHPAMRQRWEADPLLSAAVFPLIDQRGEHNPQQLTGDERLYAALRDSPPAAARRTVVVEKVLKAHAAVARLRRVLEEWPGWKNRADLLGEWTAQGWHGAATAHQLSSPPEITKGELARAIDNVLRDDEKLRDVVSAWRSFQAAAATLGASGDPVQQAMPAFFTSSVGDPSDPTEFATKLAAAAKGMTDRAAFAQGDFARRVHRTRYLDESSVRNFSPPLTADSLARWETEIREYFRLEGAQDPRRRNWDQPLAEIDGIRGDMAAAEADDRETAASVALKSGHVATEASAARDRLHELQRADVVVKDLDRITGAVRALEQDLATLLARAREALDELTPTLEKLRAWLPTQSFRNATIAAAWAERSARIEREAETAERNRFKELYRAARALAKYLSNAEKAIDELGNVDVRGTDPEVTAVVRQLEIAQRQQLSAEVLAKTVFRNEAPLISDWVQASLATGEIGGLFAAYRVWQADSAQFAGTLAQLGARLKDAYDWGEGVNADLENLSGRPQTSALLALGGVAAEWIQIARELERLSGVSDAAVLLQAANNPAMSVRVSVWRRLGGLPDWPSGISDLRVERRLAEEIGEFFTKLAAGPRRDRLAAELRTQTKLRWNRAARRAAANEQELDAVFDLMPISSIARGDLEPDVRFNYGLRELKRLDLMRLPLAELRAKRDGFVEEFKRTPAVTADRAVNALLREMEAVDLADSTRPLVAEDLLPRAAGWEGRLSEDGKRFVGHWTSKMPRAAPVSIEYVLVEPPDAAPFFLATQAMPVGAFLDLLQYHPKEKSVAATMPEWIADVASKLENDDRRWILTWQAAEHNAESRGRLVRLVPTKEWLPNRDAAVPAEIYAKDIHPPAPTMNSPVQGLAPDVARAFAKEILGARLPTPEEWRALARMYPLDSGKWNFRDATWARQQARLREIANRPEAPWPDAGIFVPSDLPAIKRRGEADAVTTEDDSALWFVPVDQGPQVGGLRNLYGNVAIYLHDETSKKFSVAGGSALSPPEINPREVYILAKNQEDGFSDVGFRPAFDASPELIQRAKLRRLLQAQGYIAQISL